MLMEEMTSPEFTRALEKTQTALLPLGSLEEHGGHLPLATDSLHMIHLARAAAQRIPVFIAPPVYYGLCRSTDRHPGTVSIGFDTVRALVRDVGISLFDQGVRRLIVASGHAGGSHLAAMTEGAQDVQQARPEMTAAVLTVVDLLAPRAADILETPGDSHAGELETSIVMHLAPELVAGTSPREFPQFPHPLLVRDKTRYWPGGVWGDPAKASAEKGAELFSRGVDALVELIGRVNQFEETPGK